MDSLAALRVPVATVSAGASGPTESSVANKGMNVMELAVESAVAPAQRSEKNGLNLPRQGSAPAAQNDSRPDPVTANMRTVRNIEIDPITRDVIFQSISNVTGEIVSQVPTEQQLKIRHYTRNGGEPLPPRPIRFA